MTEPHAGPPRVTPVWTPPPPSYGYGYPYQPQRPTNGLAITAFAVSILGLVFGVLAIFMCPVGAILGHIARRRIKESGEQGEWMARAGIIVGWIGFGLSLLAVAGIAAFVIWAESRPDF